MTDLTLERLRRSTNPADRLDVPVIEIMTRTLRESREGE
jgi:hypothetical protein